MEIGESCCKNFHDLAKRLPAAFAQGVRHFNRLGKDKFESATSLSKAFQHINKPNSAL